jgi:hypothetical protein
LCFRPRPEDATAHFACAGENGILLKKMKDQN